LEVGKFGGVFGHGEGIEEGLDIAVHEIGEVMGGVADAMVGDARLREVVGADFGAAVARRDHRLTFRCYGVVMLLERHIVELIAEHLERQFAVFGLFAGYLALNHDARRFMVELDLSFDLVDILSASARGASRLPFEVRRVDLDINLVSLREDSNGGSRGVDAALSLGDRDALDAMDTRLVFKNTISPFGRGRDIEDDLLEATDRAFGERDHLSLEPTELAIFNIHTVEVASEERCLVAASAATDLDRTVFGVLRVRRDKKRAEGVLSLGELRFERFEFLAGKLAEVSVRLRVEEMAGILDIRDQGEVAGLGGDDLLEVGVLLVERDEALAVRYYGGVGYLGFDFLKAGGEGF